MSLPRVKLGPALLGLLWGALLAAATLARAQPAPDPTADPVVKAQAEKDRRAESLRAIESALQASTEARAKLEREVAEIKEIMKKSRELGMQTFDQALFDLHEAGRIGYEDALRNADSVNDLRINIKLNGSRGRKDHGLAGSQLGIV